MRYFFKVIAVLFIFSSCSESNSDLTIQNPRISEELQQRHRAYQKKRYLECRAETIEKATLYVDSLISARISYQLSDSIFFPPKPEKPDSYGPIIIVDTVRAKPVIKLK